MLTDATITEPLQRFIRVLEGVEDLNWPLVRQGDGGAGGDSFESSEPGRQQCPELVEEVAGFIENAIIASVAAVARTTPHGALTSSERHAIKTIAREERERKEALAEEAARLEAEAAARKAVTDAEAARVRTRGNIEALLTSVDTGHVGHTMRAALAADRGARA